MRAPGTTFAVALGALGAACLAACFGYGSPIDDGSEVSGQLPQRTTPEDASVVPAPTSTAPAPGPSDAGPADSAPVDAAKKPLRAFVSSSTKTGNLGGIAAADQLCTTLATAAGLGGTYRAWLSISGADAIDHITSAGPWQLVNGDVVADNKAGLMVAQLKHLVNRDEKGAVPPDAEDRVWTGTGSNGRYVGPDCAQWAGGGSGLVGEAKNAGASNWSALAPEACTEVNRVYCFEL